MPGIDVYADNESKNLKIILFYNGDDVASKLQQIVIENLEVDIEVQMCDVGEEGELVEQYAISYRPTTLLIGEFGVLNRWVGVTHESDILPVLKRKI